MPFGSPLGSPPGLFQRRRVHSNLQKMKDHCLVHSHRQVQVHRPPALEAHGCCFGCFSGTSVVSRALRNAGHQAPDSVACDRPAWVCIPLAESCLSEVTTLKHTVQKSSKSVRQDLRKNAPLNCHTCSLRKIFDMLTK